MPEPFALTSHHLATFLACRRHFQLRYHEGYPWPPPPRGESQRRALARGQQFHQLAHRHFLGLPVVVPDDDAPLTTWWQRFQEAGPWLPPGVRLPELTITVPAGRHLLTGRLDLLVLNEDTAHIFDWKTGPLPEKAMVSEQWQTWYYPALVVAAGATIHPQGQAVPPDNVSLTYWPATAPHEPLHFSYNGTLHRKVWRKLVTLTEEIEAMASAAGIWPLTADLAVCARCRYRVLCGRQAVAPQLPAGDEDALLAPESLEPDLP